MSDKKAKELEMQLDQWKAGDLEALLVLWEAIKVDGFGQSLRRKVLKLNAAPDDWAEVIEQEIYLKLLKLNPQIVNNYEHLRAICWQMLKRKMADHIPEIIRSGNNCHDNATADGEDTVFTRTRSQEDTHSPNEEHLRMWFRDALEHRLDAVLTHPLGAPPASKKYAEQINQTVENVKWRNITFTGSMRPLVMSHINGLLQSIKQLEQEGDYYDVTDPYQPKSELLKRFFADELGFEALCSYLQRAADAQGDKGPVVAVLKLHVLAGYTHEEIGEMLGVTLDVSKKAFARAKGYLRDILGQ